MSEVGVKTWSSVLRPGERKPVCKLFGFTPRKSVDPHHRPPGVVRPVPSPGTQLPSRIKTCLECRNNRIIREIRADSIIEPSNRPGQSDRRIECLSVSDVPEDPRYTSRVIDVCPTDSGEVLGVQPWSEILDLYIPELGFHR